MHAVRRHLDICVRLGVLVLIAVGGHCFELVAVGLEEASCEVSEKAGLAFDGEVAAVAVFPNCTCPAVPNELALQDERAFFLLEADGVGLCLGHARTSQSGWMRVE